MKRRTEGSPVKKVLLVKIIDGTPCEFESLTHGVTRGKTALNR